LRQQLGHIGSLLSGGVLVGLLAEGRRLLADGREGPPSYSFGEEEKPALEDHRDLTEAAVIEKLGAILKENNQKADIRIAADRRLPAEIVMNMTAALERLKPYVREIHAEVSEQRR
jgi:hypothetical protein